MSTQPRRSAGNIDGGQFDRKHHFEQEGELVDADARPTDAVLTSLGSSQDTDPATWSWTGEAVVDAAPGEQLDITLRGLASGTGGVQDEAVTVEGGELVSYDKTTGMVTVLATSDRVVIRHESNGYGQLIGDDDEPDWDTLAARSEAREALDEREAEVRAAVEQAEAAAAALTLAKTALAKAGAEMDRVGDLSDRYPSAEVTPGYTRAENAFDAATKDVEQAQAMVDATQVRVLPFDTLAAEAGYGRASVFLTQAEKAHEHVASEDEDDF